MSASKSPVYVPPPAYSTTTVYKVGDSVLFNGVTYVMVEGAGQPGYPPLRAGDKLWKVFKGDYDNAKPYSVGDAVIFTNKALYWMQESAGPAGYAPERPGDKLWVKVQNFTYSGGARKGSRKAKGRKSKSRKGRKGSRKH
jgi:hypothetical protein